jgi:flagellar hook assembly protein FlgD
MTGKLIRQLFAGKEGAGEKTLSWDGNLDNGNRAKTGIYLVKTEIGNHTFLL